MTSETSTMKILKNLSCVTKGSFSEIRDRNINKKIEINSEDVISLSIEK